MYYSTPTGELISEDLTTQILLRLPVKSLIRFQLVDKSWLKLITSSNFILSHLKRSIAATGADQTLIVSRKDDNSISILKLNSDLTVIPVGLPYSISQFNFKPHFTIVGSHNGVVCVSVTKCPKEIAVGYDLIEYASYEIENRTIYIWNPATKRSELIRPHTICYNLKSVCIGFGYDPVDDAYMIVRLVSLWNSPLLCAEVYSTKTNDWRAVETRPYDYPQYDAFDVCVSGFICCTVSKPKKFKHKIRLWTLDDVACLRDDGLDATWTLMLNIRVDFPLWGIYGHFGSGELLLNVEEGMWILYDFEKHDSREIPLSIVDMRQIFAYDESLVSWT
ncbi:F-box/kelch-repeat protein At3g23880-like [Apium graveolens]|uniref:F-box/kelch-repeat protein At3g23880-like n=1 Tax=Apium graveolens TaxID=4045 RepID=UPI003D7BD1B3